MTDKAETYLRWEPLADMPKRPLASVRVEYDGHRLLATAKFAADPPVGRLQIDFGRIEAFKMYEEFSDPWMETTPPQPMIEGELSDRWVWPLQRVAHSGWIERMKRRNVGIEGYDWRHYVIVTMDMILHVMTSTEPQNVEFIRAS